MGLLSSGGGGGLNLGGGPDTGPDPAHDNMLLRTSDGRRDIIEISDMGWRHHEAELRGLASVTGAKFILFTRGICWIERRRERGGSSLQRAVM